MKAIMMGVVAGDDPLRMIGKKVAQDKGRLEQEVIYHQTNFVTQLEKGCIVNFKEL